jgi:predicted phage gp36 major capsid-like protein
MRGFRGRLAVGGAAALLLVAAAIGCGSKDDKGTPVSPEVQKQIDAVNSNAALTPEQKAAQIEQIQSKSAPSIPSMGGSAGAPR